MSFKFSWTRENFNEAFYADAKRLLAQALNKGNKPAIIVDHIEVTELDMGTQAPHLEVLEIGDLARDRFRGIFKLTYAGDAYIVLRTKVQANPMHVKKSRVKEGMLGQHVGVLAADKPLLVPMNLRLSDLKLRGIIVLVISKEKGVTLVFKNDPLEQVKVSTTFDSVVAIQRFIQQEIENQLRNVFQEDLPSIIHQLSLLWFKDREDLTSGQSSPIKHTKVDISSSDVSLSTSELPRPSSPTKQISSAASVYSTTTDLPEDQDEQEEKNHRKSLLPSFAIAPFSPDGDHFFLPVLSDEDPYSQCAAKSTVSSSSSSTSSTQPGESSGTKSPALNLGGVSSGFHNGFQRDREPSKIVSSSPFDPLYEEHAHATMRRQRPIVLRPSSSDFGAHLSSLISSNHTISPFSLPVEHFTYRSCPNYHSGHDTPITSVSGYAGGLHGSPRKRGKQIKRNIVHLNRNVNNNGKV